MKYDPDTKTMFEIVRNNLRMFGLWRTARDIAGYLITAPPYDLFDQVHGVKTARTMEKANAGVTDTAALADAIRYVVVPPKLMRSILDRVEAEIDPADCAFIDIGSGKGRALMLASWRPFQEIHGVELSPVLTELAEKNLATFLAGKRGPEIKCRNITAHCANALHYELPDRNLVVFMYRPFKGDILTGFLDRLAAFQQRTGHRVLVAYACPLEERFFKKHPAFHHLHENQVIVEDYSWNLWEVRAPAPAATTGNGAAHAGSAHS